MAPLASAGSTPIAARTWEACTLPEEQAEEVLKLVAKLEQDEDVQRVFHNLA